MPSKESLFAPNIREQKEQSKPVQLERVWNGVNYRAEFVKKTPTKLLLTLRSGNKTQQFEISNVRKSEDLYKSLRKAFEYTFGSSSFPSFEHPKFNKKIKQVFNELYPLESSRASIRDISSKRDLSSSESIDLEAWEEKSDNIDNEKINFNIRWYKNKYILEWKYDNKLQKVSLLWKKSKFGAKSFVVLYYKHKWSLIGKKKRISFTKDFDIFWDNFKQAINQWNLNLPDNFKQAVKKELRENLLKANLKNTSITLREAELVFQRGNTNYIVRVENHKDKAVIFVNGRKIETIDFEQGINGFSIKFGQILDETIGLPRQNVREVVLEIWDSWKLKNLSYNPEFVIKHSFGDPSIFNDLKNIFILKDEDLKEFKKNFLKFKQDIEKNESQLESSLKGVIEYLYFTYSTDFRKRGIELENIMKNWPLIYHNLKIALYYFAHLESDFKNIRENNKSSAKGYFQILTENGKWERGERAPSSFQVAVNRLYQVMKFLKEQKIEYYESIRYLIGDDIYKNLINTSRAAPFPDNINKSLLKISPAGQGLLAFVNFLVKVANEDFDMLLNTLKGEPDAILNGYLLYHHTDAGPETISRAKELSIFYFPFLREIDFTN